MKVQYDDSTHSYYTTSQSGINTPYTSATTLVNKYKEQFDAFAVSIKYAQKHGETPEYWRKKWAEKTKTACDYGTAVHKVKEQELLQAAPKSSLVVEQLVDYALLPDGTYPELKLWSHRYHIAGRSDKCRIYTVNKAKYMDIEDYKTNDDITKPAFTNWKGETKMMLSPIQHLVDCKMMHYTLQLSIYQFMAESLGFLPGERTIIHIKDGIEKPYSVPYLRNDVISILNHYRYESI